MAQIQKQNQTSENNQTIMKDPIVANISEIEKDAGKLEFKIRTDEEWNALKKVFKEGWKQTMIKMLASKGIKTWEGVVDHFGRFEETNQEKALEAVDETVDQFRAEVKVFDAFSKKDWKKYLEIFYNHPRFGGVTERDDRRIKEAAEGEMDKVFDSLAQQIRMKLLVGRYLKEGESEKAIRVGEIIEAFGNMEDLTRLEKASAHFDIEDLKTAEKIFEKIIEKDRENASAFRMLSMVRIALKKYGEALDVVSKLSDKEENYQTKYSLTLALVSNKKYDEAEKILKELIKENRKDPHPHGVLAIIYTQRAGKDKEKLSKAIEEYKKAVELSGERGIYLLSLGILYDQMGDHENAVGSYEKALRKGVILVPGTEYAFLHQAGETEYLARKGGMLKHEAHAIMVLADYYAAKVGMTQAGICKLEIPSEEVVEKVEWLINYLTNRIEEYPERGGLYHTLGNLYQTLIPSKEKKEGKDELAGKAIEAFKKVQNYDKESGSKSLLCAAALAIQKGEIDNAKKFLNNAIELDSNNLQAKAFLCTIDFVETKKDILERLKQN